MQISRDITEHKRILDDLRCSEERWRAMFENSATGMALAGSNGAYLAANPAYLTLLGYSTDELQTLSVGDTICEDDRGSLWRSFTELMAGKRQSFTTEKRMRCKDGGKIWASVQVSLIPGGEGVARFLIAIADITERRTAEEELRKFASLVENGTDFIGIASPQGEVLFVNASGRRLVGLAGNEEARLTTIFDYVARQDLDRFQGEALPRVISDGHWEGELLFRHLKTGAPIPMWQHVFWIMHQGENSRLALATISRDLTERKRAEQQIQETQAELAHMARVATMGELAASIAHEVSQPLTAVITNANASLRWLSGKQPDLNEAREALFRIVAEGSRASDVIHRIRSLVIKERPQMAPLDINDVIEEVLALIRHECRSAAVTLRTELAANLPAVLGDRVQLCQVILNLVMNAIEAMAATTEDMRDLPLTSQQGPDQVIVGVRDSGPGIDPRKLDQLFKPFFTTKPGGMGIGLSICRSAIEAHGGWLWVIPNAGRGATFQFSLRANSAPAA